MNGVLRAALCYWIFSEATVYALSRPRGGKEFDFILVLGNKQGAGSPVVVDRAKNAARAKKEFPRARIVLTGNEKIGEVSDLRRLLEAEGLSGFIEETESRSTEDNLNFSSALMGRDARVVIVTSEYHQARSLAIARSLGMTAEVFGRDRTAYPRAPLYFLKERFLILSGAPAWALSALRRRMGATHG